jgi:hypothetical protein
MRRALDEERAARRYRVPREAASDCDDARLVHADLAALDEQALSTEASNVLHALAERDRPFHERAWLAERWGRLSAELRWHAPQPIRSKMCEELAVPFRPKLRIARRASMGRSRPR